MTLETVDEIGRYLSENHKVPIQISMLGGGGKVLISPHLLGRVIAISATGSGGRNSLFTKEKAMISPDITAQFDPQGGDRFWPLPEGAKERSFYFPIGTTEFSEENWRVPGYFDKVPFNVVEWQDQKAHLRTWMNLVNVKGRIFETMVDLEYNALSTPVDLNEEVHYVGYSKKMEYTNIGTQTWDEDYGFLAPWSLCMLRAPRGNEEGAHMILPIKGGTADEILDHKIPGSGPDGELPSRLLKRDNYALFRADGQYRRKIGLRPEIARDYIGAIDLKYGLLTLMEVPVHSGAKYVDNRWNPEQKFNGSVIDCYNDSGAIAGGGPDSMYEIEGVCTVRDVTPGHKHGFTVKLHQFELKEPSNRELLYNILNTMTNVDLTHERFAA